MATGWQANGAKDAPAERVDLKVNAVRAVSANEVVFETTHFGLLRAPRSTSLAFSRGGRVAEIPANVGQQVADGDLLAALDLSQLETQITELDTRLSDLQQRIASLEGRVRSSDVVQLERRLQDDSREAAAQRRELQRQVDAGVVRAPYAGRVVTVDVSVGDLVAAGRPILQVIKDGATVVDVHVPPGLAERAEVGQAILIRDGEVSQEGAIKTISPVVNQWSQTQAITIEMQAEDGTQAWTPGRTVEALFRNRNSIEGYWLPKSALTSADGGLWAVYVVVGADDRQVVERRLIEIQVVNGNTVFVSGSLADGDLVIADGTHRVVPGQRVSPQVVQRLPSKATSLKTSVLPKYVALGKDVSR